MLTPTTSGLGLKLNRCKWTQLSQIKRLRHQELNAFKKLVHYPSITKTAIKSLVSKSKLYVNKIMNIKVLDGGFL